MTDDMMTINISMPRGMYADAQKRVAKKKFASVSELIRDALRRVLYPNIIVNGFTREFENEVLRAEKDPNNKTYIWDGKGSYTDFMDKLIKSKYGKGKGFRKK